MSYSPFLEYSLIIFTIYIDVMKDKLMRSYSTKTRMHSSRMCTAHSLTVSHSIFHPCPPPAMHAPCHACPPATHVPPAMHTPCHTCPPCHACPHHAWPPAMHTPFLACPLPHMPPCHACPPAMHALPHCGQNSWHTLLKILPCPNFVAGGKYSSDKSFTCWLWRISLNHFPRSANSNFSKSCGKCLQNLQNVVGIPFL